MEVNRDMSMQTAQRCIFCVSEVAVIMEPLNDHTNMAAKFQDHHLDKCKKKCF